MVPRKKYPKNWKLPLILVFSLIKEHQKKIAKIPQNVIFSLGAFKISQEK